jgi:hypothetical protein
MKTSFPRIVVAAVVLILIAGTMPAAAWEQSSVFPKPVDPWQSWGRPTAPSAPVVPLAPGVVVPPAQLVWVPGFWAWDGFNWVWVPPHWSHARWQW